MRLLEERWTLGRFAAFATGIVLALWVIGYLPTRRFGDEAVTAMLIAGPLALIASLVGTVPFVLSRGRKAIDKVPAALGAIALRLAVVLILAVAALMSGLVAKKAFLIWVALSHFGLLIADTIFGMAEFKDCEVSDRADENPELR